MREIKFRAFDVRTNKMWNHVMSLTRPEQTNITLVRETLDGDTEGLPTTSLYIMQFTGLRDKNGVEVYEGDLIEGDLFDHRLPTRGEVVYDNEHGCYANKNLAGLTPLSSIDKIEVVDNIYESPELIQTPSQGDNP